jgi:carboxylesterase type B
LPLVIYVHGGGLLSGDKSGGLSDLQALARLGYVGASIPSRAESRR